MHPDSAEKKVAVYLFESSPKKKYTDRGIRKILKKYSDQAGTVQSISPHKLRHFLLTWLKKQGIEDALIQPHSGHTSHLLLVNLLQTGRQKQNQFHLCVGCNSRDFDSIHV
ncbi:hypothetical protein DL897_15245 [Thermoflavimicrobium daqui]|jgi:site-specific recombinase XerD|uniref:Tyr recombinase domain-containing protein n=2 Tax=Thermoflavimicrobium daqui TaxID=2137476 RepID=A0A364K1P2_9BACL|nr:hypothetical protein DL897_15245 [Thermoflavimicrobium daqui]